MRIALTMASALLLLGACRPVAAAGPDEGERDAVVGRAWLDDPGGTLAPEAALARTWTPYEGMLSRGFTPATSWLRLRVDPAMAGPGDLPADRRLVLRIMPEVLDEVAVFRADRLADPPVMVGDTHLVSGARQSLIGHAVLLADTGAPFELLLRIRTQSNHTVDVQVMRWDDALEASFRQRMLVTAFLVFTLMVMAWAAAIWLEHRDDVLVLFVAHQGSLLLVSVTLLGILRLHGPEWLLPGLNRLTSLAIPMSFAVSFWCHSKLLAALGAHKTEVAAIRASALVPMLGFLLIVMGEVSNGLLLSQVTAPLVTILLIVAAARIRPEAVGAGETGRAWWRGYVVAVYVVMALPTVPQSLRVLGFISARRWSFFGFVVYGVLGSVLLASLLAVRARDERRRRLRFMQLLARTQREVDAQRARAEEQSELLTMLSHELKTPLSVVSLALGESGGHPSQQERARRAVDSMSNIIDRCSQTAILDNELSRNDVLPMLVSVDVHEVLSVAINSHAHAERVDCDVVPGLPPCLAERQLLDVIVSNLVENALKYSSPQGRVRASAVHAVREGRAGVALRITNRVGTAGRPDTEHLFEKYHRGARARQVSGSGLGLYLSHRLASRLGGSLTLRDEGGVNDGEVEFELWLPC